MGLKRLPEDFRDFLNSLNKNGVKYLLLGGWAVGIYGHPRATGDIDISLISREDLLKNKRASGRTKDLADVENLKNIS